MNNLTEEMILKLVFSTTYTILTFLIVAFFVFTFKALVETSCNDVNSVCKESNLWYYLTTIFIINVLSNNDNKKNYIEFFCVNTGFFLWGLYELFGVKCVNNLHSTLLYEFSLSYWIFISVVLFLVICVYVCSLLWGYRITLDKTDKNAYLNLNKVTRHSSENKKVLISGNKIEVTVDTKKDLVDKVDDTKKDLVDKVENKDENDIEVVNEKTTDLIKTTLESYNQLKKELEQMNEKIKTYL